jgi:hypothetical protein
MDRPKEDSGLIHNQLPRRAGKVSLKGQSAAAVERSLGTGRGFFLINPKGAGSSFRGTPESRAD